MEDLLAALEEGFRSRAHPISIVSKSAHVHQRAADFLLRVLTLNGQKTYLTHYVTTLGHTIYVPLGFSSWSAHRRYTVLRHEAVHVAQFERFGFLLMTLIYGFLPLPAGLAYGRARLEWEAYRETISAIWEVEGRAAAFDPRLHREIVNRFAGPDYGWMWPFRRQVQLWLEAHLEQLDRAAIP